MTLTRIVAQLDYDHEGPNSEVQALATDLFDHLTAFAAGYPGLEMVVVGFAEVNDEADAPCDRSAEGAGGRR